MTVETKTAPQDAEGWFREGVAHLDADRPADAKAAFERAVALDPRHAKANNNLGTLLQWDGCRDEAEACYRREIGRAHV